MFSARKSGVYKIDLCNHSSIKSFAMNKKVQAEDKSIPKEKTLTINIQGVIQIVFGINNCFWAHKR